MHRASGAACEPDEEQLHQRYALGSQQVAIYRISQPASLKPFGWPSSKGVQRHESVTQAHARDGVPASNALSCRSEGQAARVPAVPRHLATPSLMGRAGDPTYYDEPELGRITPPAEHPPSRFTLAGNYDALLC